MIQANSGPTLPSSGVVSASPPKYGCPYRVSFYIILSGWIWLETTCERVDMSWIALVGLQQSRPSVLLDLRWGFPVFQMQRLPKYILILNKRSSGKITVFSQLGAQLYSNWFIVLQIVNYVWLAKIPQEHVIDTFLWEDSSRMPPSAPVWIIFGCEKRSKLYFSWDLTP